jgi:hypothetical protein
MQRHGHEAAEDIRREVQQVQHSLRVGSKKLELERCVLHPEKNKHLRQWDMVTTIGLIYTATVTPFEAAFVEPVSGHKAWDDPWFLISASPATQLPTADMNHRLLLLFLLLLSRRWC